MAYHRPLGNMTYTYIYTMQKSKRTSDDLMWSILQFCNIPCTYISRCIPHIIHTYIHISLCLSLTIMSPPKRLRNPFSFPYLFILHAASFVEESLILPCVWASEFLVQLVPSYVYIYIYLFIYIYIYIHKSYVHMLDKIVVAKWLKGVTKWLNQSVLSWGTLCLVIVVLRNGSVMAY